MKYEVSGVGDPIILVPGGLTGWISWIPHAEQLSSRRRVIRVQLLSVDLGLRNEPLPQSYSVDYETSALLNSLDQLGLSQADFAAWSYGALVALNLALKYPDRIRTLTLIEPPAIWVIRSRGPLSRDLQDQRKQLQGIGPGDVSEEQLEWFTHFAGFVPSGVDPRKLPQWPSWVQHRQSLRTGDAVFRHEGDMSKVRGFRKPVLLFKGEGSSGFLLQIVDILGEEFPSVRVEMLPGGHAPHLVSMGRFMEIFRDFIEYPVV